MVKLNKIYTRSGDKGTTVLVTGERVGKTHARIAAYGTVDETNSAIGMARVYTTGKLDDMLARIQNDCFDLGSDLGTPDPEDGSDLGYEPLRIIEAQVTRLENEIDELNAELEPLTSFVLPGGCEAAANLHLARTTARRAERLMVEAAETEKISEAALKYINRLSDFLFVAARYANDKGASDVLWVPGANR
ncbi:MAG: cob(I)yrinic acid a,c-diamide adenosyltransferase [Alphaproteobacteria bacterium]|nr:MAG: cob(I)yrinic acid a,c-diamide adenosyltransferase [Alphaproteobacteria bacterium]